MIITEMAQSTEELKQKLNAMYLLSVVIASKIKDLEERITLNQQEYNPYNKRSLGTLTVELNRIADLGYKIGVIAETL